MHLHPTILKAVVVIITIAVPIAAVAADATAPPALAEQSTAWTTADYLRAALSGAAGGLISGLLALVIGWMNNKSALKRQHQADKHQIEMLQLEEKKKIATDILLAANPIMLHKNRELDVVNIIKLHHIALLICTDEYCCYTKGLVDLAMQTNGLSQTYLLRLSRERHKAILDSYSRYYNICIHVSRLMLTNQNIIPTHGWNIDNFEESIPLDYRKLIS